MSSPSTRWTVIRGAAQGMPAAQAEFAKLYGPVVRATLRARWRQTPLFHEVDDAAQQVFVDCFKSDGALGRADEARETGFGAFLYGVVRNVARSFERERARSRERQATGAVDLEAVTSREDSCAKVFDRAWAGAILRDAAALQLERAREAGPEAVRRHELLGLRYGENLPVREIAARWGVDPDALHREATRAREEFKQALFDVVRELQGPRGVEAECQRLLACSF